MELTCTAHNVLKYLAHSFMLTCTSTMMSRSSTRDSYVTKRPLMTITYCRNQEVKNNEDSTFHAVVLPLDTRSVINQRLLEFELFVKPSSIFHQSCKKNCMADPTNSSHYCCCTTTGSRDRTYLDMTSCILSKQDTTAAY